MIQVAKRVLRKLLRNARLSYEELLTVLTESECTINSRPLTHMTSDEFDGVPLTPSHLLHGSRIPSLPDAQPKTDKDFNSREVYYQENEVCRSVTWTFLETIQQGTFTVSS